MRRSLYFRLTLIIFSVAIVTSLFWLVTIRVFIDNMAELNQQEFVFLMGDFLDKTEDRVEVQNLPIDLQNDLSSIQQNLAQRIDLLDSLARWRWLWITSLFIVSAFLTYLLALFLARRLTRPIKSVALASRKLAKGDLEARVSAEKNTWDNYSLALANDFNEMAASLAQLQEERQTMIGDIAHELRTPVAIMQAQLESLQDGVDPLDLEAVDSLYEETKLLSRLITDLRMLSLAEAKQLSLNLTKLELFGFLEKLRSSFSGQANLKSIDISLEGTQGLSVEADAERLRQMIGNLLSNALRYTPEGGKVMLRLEQQGSWALISVRDTGLGLSEEALGQLFNRFYRSDKGRVRAEGGSGLGLAIVKALTELHGGQVSAENHKAGGALFRVRLALA